MRTNLPHISVCICTYKRPDLLRRTLEGVCAQDTGGQFSYSVVVADNDKAESARTVVAVAASCSDVQIVYAPEPRQGIARARNKAVASATGDYIAFIDDDEIPVGPWLLTLFKTIRQYDVAGVLAPVNPYFEEGAPNWVIKGGFYSRPVHPTGMTLQFRQCRTGNVLLKRELLVGSDEPFNPACLSGEDQDFFRRKIGESKIFVWCHEAPVYEVVPPVRWKRTFLFRRALFRGIFAQRNHGRQPIRVLQAIVSVPAYIVALPFAAIFGQSIFMICAFKLCYHAGRVFAILGVNPIQQPYVYD
jgi:glycosyltransferase involved in cell wall biosynthesis